MTDCNIHFLPAGQGDCILIKFLGESGNYRHVLIDGGKERSTLIYNKLKKRILEIIGSDGFIDVVVVTHSDDDHIGGILKLSTDKQTEGLIKSYWFNSERLISQCLSSTHPMTQNYPVGATSAIEPSNLRQDRDLYDVITALDGNICNSELLLAGQVKYLDGAKVSFLSPTVEALEKLLCYWKTQEPKLEARSPIEPSKRVKTNDYQFTINELTEKLHYFLEDDREVNCSSIALLFQLGECRYLLLGDSQPSVVAESLVQLKYSKENRLVVDCVKLSHHGSKKNTSDELLDLVECDNFVICANGRGSSCHPDKKTLVRVLNKNQNAKFYFPKKGPELQQIFEVDDTDFCKFPTDGTSGVTF